MRNFMIGIFLAAVIVGCASAPVQQPPAFAWTEPAALIAAKQWADAAGKPDVVELEKILAEDYVHIHATALVENKRQFIDALKTGTRKYDPIVLEETKVRIYGTTAIVNARFRLKAFSGGRTIEGVNRITLVIVQSSRDFQVASFQATPIPPAAGK